jgi:hypothetical protein
MKLQFPVTVDLFEAVGMKSDIALNFLSRWQTLHELRRAKPHTVRSFFYAHNSRSQSLIEKRLRQIGEAHEVTDDPALIEPMVLVNKCLVGQLRQCNQTINEFDRKSRPAINTESVRTGSGFLNRGIVRSVRTAKGKIRKASGDF